MIHVVKLGGSLMDLPDLVLRFEQWRSRDDAIVLVVGGGDAADAVRAFDRQFALGPERSHWLAVRAMQFNAHLVAAAIQPVQIVSGPEECDLAAPQGPINVVDPLTWLSREEGGGRGSVPHRWSFTSDSIAAHIATTLRAHRLTLLKSTLPPERSTVADAARLGIVDGDFEAASATLPHVDLVNLRATPSATLRLR